MDESRPEDELRSFITHPVLRTEAEAVGQRLDVRLTEDPKTWFALGLLILTILFWNTLISQEKGFV